MLALALLGSRANAEDAVSPRYNVHFQSTVIDQGHFKFHSQYFGTNSLRPETETATSITSTFFFGLRIVPGTELYLDPELSGGRGISGALGAAGFPNGETFRIGDARPVVSTARLFLKQVFGFGNETESVADGQNQLAGTASARRLTVVAGKYGLADYFDGNAYAHDPRSQFMNWTLMDAGAWDYPADTRGYTWGVMTEYHAPDWAVRGAAATEPKVANQMDIDRRIGRSHGFVIEGEHALRLGERKGTARALAFLNEAPMGNYDETVANAAFGMDVSRNRAYGRTKYGFSTSNDLELSPHLGAFVRLSWSDGRNEAWAFTPVDASQSAGLDWKPAAWGRPKDDWGGAFVMNELDNPARRYLSSGGSTFIIGDGGLHYGPETIFETYYRFQAKDWLAVSPDAQMLFNPAYNRSRGPVPVWALRVHIEL